MSKGVIIGFDLSMRSTGVAVLRDDGTLITDLMLPDGVTHCEKLSSLGQQFAKLFTDVQEIDMIVIEQALISKYADATKQVMMVHGVLMMVIGTTDLQAPLLSIHPLTLKRVVTGSGSRKQGKEVMQEAIERITGLYMSNDEADATALALVGRAVGEDALPNQENVYSKIVDNDIEDKVYRLFGLDRATVDREQEDKQKQYRKEYYEKNKDKIADRRRVKDKLKKQADVVNLTDFESAALTDEQLASPLFVNCTKEDLDAYRTKTRSLT